MPGEEHDALAPVRAAVTVPTVEAPTYLLLVSELAPGRRFMSDDLALLNAVATSLARRVDAVRVAHVRCQHELREQETSKLATEAELLPGSGQDTNARMGVQDFADRPHRLLQNVFQVIDD